MRTGEEGMRQHRADRRIHASLRRDLRKILRERLQQMWSNKPAALLGTDIEAVHDMRVAALRLRTLLRLFRACFPKKPLKHHLEALVGLVDALGSVREHDIFLEYLRAEYAHIAAKDAPAVDMLLARETVERALRALRSVTQGLERRGFGASFEAFLKESLGTL